MLTLVVRMFKIVVIQTNLGKTNSIVCTPGIIWGQHGVAVYKQRGTGEGDTFEGQKKTRVSCEECGTAMTALSLRHNMEISHGIVIT